MSESVLVANRISFQFRSEFVLRDVTVELARGEVVALIGPNGSGKSTLLKILAGILPSPCGQVSFMGKPFDEFSTKEKAQRVTYVGPELRAEFPLTAYEAVSLAQITRNFGFLAKGTPADDSAIQRAMERCFCWEFRDRDLHTLSGGEKQLVALARALAQGAKVLFLDEALSRMDLNHQSLMGKLLKTLTDDGYSIILVAHDMNLASEWADRCALLRKGQLIAAGPVTEILTVEHLRELYPGAALVIATNPATGVPKVFFGR